MEPLIFKKKAESYELEKFRIIINSELVIKSNFRAYSGKENL